MMIAGRRLTFLLCIWLICSVLGFANRPAHVYHKGAPPATDRTQLLEHCSASVPVSLPVPKHKEAPIPFGQEKSRVKNEQKSPFFQMTVFCQVSYTARFKSCCLLTGNGLFLWKTPIYIRFCALKIFA